MTARGTLSFTTKHEDRGARRDGTSRGIGYNVPSMPKLVLVSDAEWVVNQVFAALAVGDWDIEVLSDPRTAPAQVGQIEPDVVVVDLQISSKGGMAVIRAIRQGGAPRPRLVMLLDRSADAFLARRAGADAHVQKPIKPSELRAALADVMPAAAAVAGGAGSEEE
jgi:two-component system, OmpR family, response regulator MprA